MTEQEKDKKPETGLWEMHGETDVDTGQTGQWKRGIHADTGFPEKDAVKADISAQKEGEEQHTETDLPQNENDLRAEIDALRQEVVVLNGKLRQIERMLGLRERRTGTAPAVPVSSTSSVPPISHGSSIVPQMRRQRAQDRENRPSRRIEEKDVGKYGSAFLAAVCILAGVGVILAAAWALSDAIIQAVLLFALGLVLAGSGWIFIRRGSVSATPPTLAACGLGILYMTCVSMHFLWNFIPVEGVLLCILVWTGAVFYMAHTGRTLLFYYVLNLGSLATACLSAVHTESQMQSWAGTLFTTAVYGAALFQVHRLTGRETGRVLPVRRLKNVTAVNALVAYAVLFLHVQIEPSMLVYALLVGGILLFCWYLWFQGSAGMETAGIMVVEIQMVVSVTRLAFELEGMRATAVSFAVLLLFLLPLLRAGQRALLSAWTLWPVLWQAGLVSHFLTGTVYPIPYIVLTVYYIWMLFRPAACKIWGFVPAYTCMYLILAVETRYPVGGLTFALMTLYALGVPVKYMLMVLSGSYHERGKGAKRCMTVDGQESYDRQYKKGDSCFSRRYGTAMLAAYVVCITYCAGIERPVALLLGGIMLVVFFGMTVWMEAKTHHFSRVLRIGMVLLWVMTRILVSWCVQEGIFLEIWAGILCLLSGSLAAVCGIHVTLNPQNEGAGVFYGPVSLALFSLGLYRLLLVFSLPYAILVSLILLLSAVGILLLGFRLGNRQVRAYALFLMALCVVKMLTADLSGENLGWRAAALAGGGVLCLIVSTVYSRRERKSELADEEQNG